MLYLAGDKPSPVEKDVYLKRWGAVEMTRLYLNVVSGHSNITRPPLHGGLYNVDHFKQTRASFYKHVLLESGGADGDVILLAIKHCHFSIETRA